MPRGSKPGERRGGRQRGTPNKRTQLKNAVFLAAAQHRSSPLDFMLGVMRDPQVPTDLRLDMAVAAAPFVHEKPKAPVRETKSASTNKEFSPFETRVEFKIAPRPAAVVGVDQTPLDYLVSVMNDPEALPRQRVRAARPQYHIFTPICVGRSRRWSSMTPTVSTLTLIRRASCGMP
jgi:hypothetical protein